MKWCEIKYENANVVYRTEVLSNQHLLKMIIMLTKRNHMSNIICQAISTNYNVIHLVIYDQLRK